MGKDALLKREEVLIGVIECELSKAFGVLFYYLAIKKGPGGPLSNREFNY